MFKYDDYVIVISNSLRKIILDLLNEKNYSGEEIEIEPPTRRYFRKHNRQYQK